MYDSMFGFFLCVCVFFFFKSSRTANSPHSSCSFVPTPSPQSGDACAIWFLKVVLVMLPLPLQPLVTFPPCPGSLWFTMECRAILFCGVVYWQINQFRRCGSRGNPRPLWQAARITICRMAVYMCTRTTASSFRELHQNPLTPDTAYWRCLLYTSPSPRD